MSVNNKCFTREDNILFIIYIFIIITNEFFEFRVSSATGHPFVLYKYNSCRIVSRVVNG